VDWRATRRGSAGDPGLRSDAIEAALGLPRPTHYRTPQRPGLTTTDEPDHRNTMPDIRNNRGAGGDGTRRARGGAGAAAIAGGGSHRAIAAMAGQLRARAAQVMAANAEDLDAAAAGRIDAAQLDRHQARSGARGRSMALSLEKVRPSPIRSGAEMARWTAPSGLDIARVRTPIGVIAVIYEARPERHTAGRPPPCASALATR